ncbi:HNH endonuclease [Salmonella phage SPLA5a]|nr:HNH endonuclease [Salmonella phage SPLA5a]
MIDWKKEFTQSEMKNLEERYHTKVERTKKRGIEFSLTLDDWFMMGKKLLGMGTCDYTNMPFHMGTVAGYNPKYPSVERIDDKKGYVRGNVCVVMRRANELKDCLVDKKTAITIIEPLDREIVQAMMLNMSKDHMEMLKTKYIPQQENEMIAIEEKLSQEAEKHMHKGEVTEEVTNAVEEVVEKAPEPAKLPDDVAVALAYANYCKTFSDVGMNVSVTYAQFKAKYVRNTCSMTGEKLSGEPKSILILDLKVGFAKDNFIIVSKKMETAMTQLMIQTGLSLPKITAMLNKVV